MWISAIVALAVCVFGLVTLCAVSNELVGSHPTDQQMLDNFQAHKTEFSQLLQMFLADQKLMGVAYQWTDPANLQSAGITPERLKAYDGLFWKVNLGLALRPSLSLRRHYGQENLEAVEFTVSTRGLAVSGSVKGYVYTFKRPSLMVDNLDTYRSKDSKSFTAYRYIEGNWYLFYDYDD